MSENVVSLRGGQVLDAAPPNEKLVQFLEEALEKARSGEAQGMAIALVHRDYTTTCCVTGAVTRSLLGAVEIVKFDLLKALD